MENCTWQTFHTFKSLFNKMFTCLAQNLNCYIVRNTFFINKPAQKIIFSVRRTWKANFNLFKTKFYKQIKKSKFLFNSHRIYKSLISISQIYRTPYWSLRNLFVRPCAVFDGNRFKCLVLFNFHSKISFF